MSGLPEPLPYGERILWQGSPGWAAIARHALHLRGLAVYFGLLVLWVLVSATLHGGPVLLPTAKAAAAAALPLALGLLYAWGVARSTTYTVTSSRVLIRMGIALPLTLNLPFAEITSADITNRADGTGDIALTLVDAGRKLSWFLLWPHVRPFRMGRAQPQLRGLADAASAGQTLSRALALSADMDVPLAKTFGTVDSGAHHHGATTVTA